MSPNDASAAEPIIRAEQKAAITALFTAASITAFTPGVAQGLS